jgi:hypothetical protein
MQHPPGRRDALRRISYQLITGILENFLARQKNYLLNAKKEKKCKKGEVNFCSLWDTVFIFLSGRELKMVKNNKRREIQ